MSDEPSAKKPKTDSETANSFEVSQKSLEDLDKVQGRLDKLNEQASSEIIKVEQKFNSLRAPHYEDRQSLIDGIPNFWITVFINHPVVCNYLTEEDEEALHYLNKLEVFEEFSDGKNGFKLKFVFDINPFFSNTEIVKEVITPHNGDPEGKCTKIDWKPNKDITNGGQTASFFTWLTDSTDPADELSDVIKDDVWVNPVQYYLLPDVNGDVEDGDLPSDEDGRDDLDN